MKLKHALIENFKGIKRCEIDFISPSSQSPRFLTAIVGDNGSGKTTVLQAIALTLSMATRRTPHHSADQLRWLGFRADRLGTHGATRVELEVVFTQDELEATRSLYDQWQDPTRPSVQPAMFPSVTLVFEKGRTSSPQGNAAFYQFLGRYYVKTRLKTLPQLRPFFRRVGDVFWFDQLRNLGSRLRDTSEKEGGRDPADEASSFEQNENWTAGVEQLREDLIGWWGYHTSPKRDPANDYLARLEPWLARIFPGTKILGLEPRGSANSQRPEFDVLFERNGVSFDLAEFSSGEQAVFPILSEFVRLEIARSVVLIDELELHLHPPQQQALLGALRKIGPDCQFIFTTHSSYLSEALPNEEIVRVEGGRPCL